MNTYGVIMAGGGGTRFWPLSRQAMPKQLLNLSGNDALINETIKRIRRFIEKENIYIVTNEKQKAPLQEVISTLEMYNQILLEPSARNTAACIGYAAIQILKNHGDGIMCVFPADHYIKNDIEFESVLVKAIRTAEETNKLVTVGIKPTFPSTGFGYIKFNQEAPSGKEAYGVLEFVEKPTFETAKAYIDSQQYLWNSGIFIWKASTVLDNFKRFLPKVYSKLEELAEYLGSEQEAERFSEIYPEIPSISIDYGIMERSDDVLVIPGDFGWNDVGSWDSLGAIYPADDLGNIIHGENIKIETENSIVYSTGRLIATIGIKDMIIVETPDTLLVCPKEKAQSVKQVVDILREHGKEQYL